MQTTTNYLQQRRKMALLLPVIVVPCLIYAFYGLGGGKGSAGATATGMVRGVNMSLPAAQVDAKKTPDKLQLYEKAAVDSAKLLEQQKQDPYVGGRGGVGDTLHGRWGLGASNVAMGPAGRLTGADGPAGWYGASAPPGGPGMASRAAGLSAAGPFGSGGVGWHGLQMGGDQRQRTIDATTDEVMMRVAELKKLINAPASSGLSGSAVVGGAGWTPGHVSGGRVDVASEGVQERAGAGRDPEMERIDGMLDKLIRIQHPDLVGRDTSGAGKAAGAVLVLTVPRQEETVRGLGAEVSGGGESSGFIEIGEADRTDTVRRIGGEALEATIDGDQTVMSGSWVALRLSRGANLGGLALPAGQLLTGEASISGERLKVHISAIRVGTSILPVDIQVYDLDGVAGIRVPGAMTRDVSKESAAEAMSGLGVASMDPSLAGQAANAGLQLAKSLTGRKLRAVRVALPAGYRILLRNNKTGL